MGWIECVSCEKLQRDFVARTFALIALIHPIFHRVSCSYQTIPNAPKHYESYQNMSLGSNVVDQVCSLRKITIWLRVTNFCIKFTCSPYFALNFMQLQNSPKSTQPLWNAQKHECWIRGGGSGAFVATNSDKTSWHKILHYLHQFNPFCNKFHAVIKRSQMQPNTTRHTKTWV